MKLGIDMHQMALDCVRRELSQQRPGGFSLEPRYHRNPRTQAWEPLSNKEAQALVVHDFKFPCLGDAPSKWRVYPRGHPHAGRTQKFMYELAVGAPAFRIIPRWGVLP
ncbi:hypothetical protein [Corallococcus macrosporus]|uniref:Uncharacterized protein n=1 Tax=Myxococcus fulvus (strain ATCC BAA-855 / HW-1) TaxID=483219 RepID=F8CFQ6_MYXFH|nr:hypothetical protein [Corallococcus macrosporus]AEI64875.1 hypothetical protein LILAB_14850 [Corallococcus macrosporus]